MKKQEGLFEQIMSMNRLTSMIKECDYLKKYDPSNKLIRKFDKMIKYEKSKLVN